MNNQTYTSANTSINSSKLPTAITKFSAYGRVLDYGCGKFYSHTQNYVESSGATYFPYDPYNVDTETNLKTLDYGSTHSFDTIFCCNVLNVIDSDDEIWRILHNMYNMLGVYGVLYIQIYEGNKTGIGKCTKKDCYQRNMKTTEYFRFFGAFQGSPFKFSFHGNIIKIVKD